MNEKRDDGTGFHIAQANWARMIAPIDDPLMADFVGQLAAINGLAEESPGFVWRLQGDDGSSTSIRAFEDESILFNMSVWESLEALKEYTYRTRHVEVFRNRGRWFDSPDRAPLVLWWVPAGPVLTVPTVEDGRSKLEQIWAEGPTPAAFTFREPFDPPSA